MPAGRKALVVATYRYADGGLSGLAAPEHDAEAFAAVLEDPEIAGFDVTMLLNQPHHVVGEAIADFYGDCRRDDLTLLYFSGHGLKDDEGRLHLAMTNTRREALMFTAISAAQLNEAMDACASRRKVLILDCCYSGAFPAGRTAKSDEGVQTLERFQGKGRAVLTASDATQYAFEGDDVRGSGISSVFTRHLVEAIRSGAADLDEDGDIALDELYSYVREKVVAEVPQQRPKKQEDVDGRILIARNVHWTLPAHLRHAIDSPISAQRLSAVEGLAHLHRVGNDLVRATVAGHVAALADDDSRSVSAAATALLQQIGSSRVRPPEVELPAPRAASAPATVERPVLAVPVPVPSAAPVRPPSPPAEPAPAERRRAEPPAEPPPAEPPAGPSLTEPPAVVPGAPENDAPVLGAGRTSRQAPPLRQARLLVLALVVLSGLPLTLSRLLAFEASAPNTADEFSESTLPWSLLIVGPLVASVALLAAGARFPRAVPVAAGLVVGEGLVLLENAGFWSFWFIDNNDSYDAGPALWCLVLGAVVVAAAGVVAVTRPPLAGRPGVRSPDWRFAVALLVVIAAAISLDGGPESYSFSSWISTSIGTLLLGAFALPLTLVRLRRDQRLAALVAVSLFGMWLLWFPLSELVSDSPRLGLEPSRWVARIVDVVLTLLACGLAQAGPTSEPAAASRTSRTSP